MSTRFVALGAAVITAATLTACSSSGGGTPASKAPGSATSGSTTSAPSTQPATSTPASARTSSTVGAPNLDSIVLALADLPSGWTPAAHDTSGDNSSADKALLSCIGAKDTSADSITKVNSPDFSMGDNSITSNAELFKTDADIAEDVALLSNSKTKSCYTTLFRQGLTATLPAGATVNSLTLDVAPGSNGGPSNVAAVIAAHAQVTSQGRTTNLYDDIVFITGKRIEAQVELTGIGARISAATRANAVSAVAARAAKA